MADWVRVALADLPHVDGAGKRTPVVITQGNVGSSTAEIPLVLGRSQTFMALDDCVALVLLRGGQVVGRVPVSLLPGEMNVLRP